VLIGTSAYRSRDLADLPAVRNNLSDLAATLTDPQFGAISRDRCTVVADPADPRGVYRALRTAAASTEDTLLVYFAGHGRTGTRNELYLGLADTDPDELRVSALPFDLIRDVLADSPAANRVVILDCCFSGRAVQDMAGAEETILGQIGVEGTYVLASAPANEVSLAPLGARYTSFTGELLGLLRAGVPGGPSLLTFGMIYRHLLYTTTARGLPVPRQRGTGTVDHLALTRNPAAASVASATVPLASPAASVASAPAVLGPSLDPARGRPPSAPPRPASAFYAVAAWLSVAAALVYGLSRVIDRSLGMLLDSRMHTYLTNGDGVRGSGYYVSHAVVALSGPVADTAVCLVAAWLVGKPDRRAFNGAGILIGYGVWIAAKVPAYVDHQFGIGPVSFDYIALARAPQIMVPGMLLVALAATLAAIGCLRQRPFVRLIRPARPVPAAVIGVAGLAAAGLYTWMVRPFSGPATVVVFWIFAAALAVLLPIARTVVRPGALAGGLVAGWLAIATTIELARVALWLQATTTDRVLTVMFIAANSAVLMISVVYPSEPAE
jgi:hypothetical protein